MPIHRHIKNVVHNYTDAERKVREATSNDPWGPSSTLMAEIADKTHNVMAFTEIMQMIWRRLNDKSKNWRHVYKSLVLLDYLTKTGSDKVATQCRENIHSIETLKDFEYVEDGKDCGQNVREKARLLSSLLRDEERLHEERTKALLARDRLMHGGLGITASASAGGDSPNKYGFSSSGRSSYPIGYPGSSYFEKSTLPLPSKSPVPHASTELESVRPQSAGEEQLHLQLALAISKEEHDREERRRRAEEAKEEAKVQMVIEQSRREEQKDKSSRHSTSNIPSASSAFESPSYTSSGGLFSLVDTSLSAAPAHLPDPWSTPLVPPNNPLNNTSSPTPSTSFTNTPGPSTSTFPLIPIDDPWSPKSQPNVQAYPTANNNSDNVWNLESTLGATLPSTSDAYNESNNPLSHNQQQHTNNHVNTTNNTNTVTATPATNTMTNNNGHFDFDLNGNVANNNNDSFQQQQQQPQAVASSSSPSSSSAQTNQASSSANELQQDQQPVRKRTPADFLGEHQKLVDLEKLVEKNPDHLYVNCICVGGTVVRTLVDHAHGPRFDSLPTYT
uniref:ENTH domain-containing protein n=1 Tax=Trichobilharzia regenti TaxID=157069 RepID=A0AA85JS40_TRIRE|nr:unnamed protein product [Trichobilharzia regenti]